MELELRRLEDLAKSIVDDFSYMRNREEEMRDTNGKSVCVKEVESADLHCSDLYNLHNRSLPFFHRVYPHESALF